MEHKNLMPFSCIPALDVETLNLVEATWTAGGLDDLDWENITGHMAAVAALAIAMAEKINPELIKTAAISSLIHDACKRREVEAVKAAKAAGGDISATYDELAAAQERFLLEQGWCPNVVVAAQSVGHTSLAGFINNAGITLLQKIVHLADDLTSGAKYNPLAERMSGLREKYPTIHQDGPSRYSLPGLTFDVQEAMANNLLDEFGKQVGLSPEQFYNEVVKRAEEILNT